MAPASFFGRLVEGQFRLGPALWPGLAARPDDPRAVLAAVPPDRATDPIQGVRSGLTDGALQGAIPADAFGEAFRSSLAQLIADRVASQPDSPTTTALIALFAGDAAPGTITSVDQWRQALEGSSLLETLLKPDIVVNGNPAVSFGIGFTASAAAF